MSRLIKGASSQFVYQVAGYHNRIENYLTGQILTGAAASAAMRRLRLTVMVVPGM